MDPIQLLPDAQAWIVDAEQYADEVIEIDLRASQVTASCPSCGQISTRRHSTYTRTVRDTPWGKVPIRLRLTMRRFFCDNPECNRCTFTEQIPTTVAPYARRTQRLQEAQRAVAFALGGEAGTRLAQALHISTSADTLLRSIRCAWEGTPICPRVVGIDDWAMRKGHRYGTIIINLEEHRPIDLLPDRETATVATWLKQYPSIEIVTRDRANAYAEGIRQGAPQAIQVADRWHLLQNLLEAVKRFMDRQHSTLRQIKMSSSEHRVAVTSPILTPEALLNKPKVSSRTQLTVERRAKRLHQYEQVHILHQQGRSQRQIARQLRLHRKTIRRYLNTDVFPERAARRAMPDPLLSFLPYLDRQWQAGFHNAIQLWREIRQQGYMGSQIRVSRWAHQQRQSLVQTNPGQPVLTSSRHSLSARQAAWLVVCPTKDLEPDEQEVLAQLKQVCPPTEVVHTLAQSFGQMIREHQKNQLADWIQAARCSGLDDLRHFAIGLERDYAAVEAALRFAWSNGQTEGQVHRLKLIKRQMYGRANFDLLRLRVLHNTS